MLPSWAALLPLVWLVTSSTLCTVACCLPPLPVFTLFAFLGSCEPDGSQSLSLEQTRLHTVKQHRHAQTHVI